MAEQINEIIDCSCSPDLLFERDCYSAGLFRHSGSDQDAFPVSSDTLSREDRETLTLLE